MDTNISALRTMSSASGVSCYSTSLFNIDPEVRVSQRGSSCGPRQQTGPTRCSKSRRSVPETGLEDNMWGQGLVHPALLGHDRYGAGGRFWENDLSDEDSTETDSRGHQAEDEVQGTEPHCGETSFALQQVMDGCVLESLSLVAVQQQHQREEDKTMDGKIRPLITVTGGPTQFQWKQNAQINLRSKWLWTRVRSNIKWAQTL